MRFFLFQQLRLACLSAFLLTCSLLPRATNADSLPNSDPNWSVVVAINNMRVDLASQVKDTNRLALALGAPGGPHVLDLFYAFSELANLVQEDKELRFDVERSLDHQLLSAKGGGTTLHPDPNQVTFGTLVGRPYDRVLSESASKAEAYKYVKNAGGLNIRHEYVRNDPSQEIQDYYAEVNRSLAIQSFNGYVLGYIYADHGHRSKIDQQLAVQASNNEWQKQVYTEPPSDVLRQMLMFESQMYLQQARLIELQRDSLTAQVMTNALLLQDAKIREDQMLNKIRPNDPRGPVEPHDAGNSYNPGDSKIPPVPKP
jgi:hypothetical protein